MYNRLLFAINLFGHIRAGDAHSDANVSLLESGGIVDTVTSYCHNGAQTLATLNNDQLLLGRGTGEHNLRVEPDNKRSVFS